MQTILIGLDTRINNYASIDLMQGYNYTLEAHITDNYKDMDLTGVTVQLQMQKPDKKFIIQTENIVIEGNKIKATLDKDFTREDGQAKLQVVLFKDKFTFGSWVVKAKIKPSAINDNDGQSDNKVTITEALVNKISEAENTKIELDKSIANGDVATIKGNVDKIKDVEIPKINSQLETKASKTEIFTMANMGQDVKEAMTGGSVAVVGKNAVLTENIVDGQVTPLKTDFLEIGKNKFNKNTISQMGYWCNFVNGKIESTQYTTNYHYSEKIKVVSGATYVRKYNMSAQIFFDVDGKFISGNKDNPFVVPNNADYMIINVLNTEINDEQIEMGEVKTSYETYQLSFKSKLNTKQSFSEISGSVGVDQIPFIEIGKNKFNNKTLSELGKWRNYTTGKIETYPTNSYIQNYRYSDFIPVKANTEYTRKYYSDGLCFFTSDKVFISGSNSTSTFTTPSNCSYITINLQDGKNLEQLEEGNIPTEFEAYGLRFSTDSETSEIVTIGEGGDFTTIKDGFSFALANDLPVLIQPGVYDVVAEGINGVGYIAPKKIYGYGAKIVCNLPSENWLLSPINVSKNTKGSEIYGLTIIASNCRYCIHDDMGGQTHTFYNNIFKDLTLIHNSVQSATLLAPQCIGGGFGDYGNVTIDNCVFNCKYFADVSYHSLSVAPSRPQTNNCTLKCYNSVFSGTLGTSSVGTDTSFLNTCYINNCLFGSLPNTNPQPNIKVVSWNNVKLTS